MAGHDGRTRMAGHEWQDTDGRTWTAGHGWQDMVGRTWIAGHGLLDTDCRTRIAGHGYEYNLRPDLGNIFLVLEFLHGF